MYVLKIKRILPKDFLSNKLNNNYMLSNNKSISNNINNVNRYQKILSSLVCVIISSTSQSNILHNLSIVLVYILIMS